MIRVAIFIDGPSLYRMAKDAGFDPDFSVLGPHLAEGSDFILCQHYFALVADDGEYEGIQKLIDWLDDHGYRITAHAGHYQHNASQVRYLAGTVAVEIACEALAIADHFDTAVIVSGDPELVPLVTRLQSIGKRVVIAGCGSASAELRRSGDYFNNLEKLRDLIARRVPAAKEAAPA
jgi:uncharacterized LabA/DUF88 family protein